jgi:ribosomal protein L11 methylase PrmA
MKERPDPSRLPLLLAWPRTRMWRVRRWMSKEAAARSRDKRNKRKDKDKTKKAGARGTGSKGAGGHQEMLSDKVRTQTYSDAIMKQPHLIKDKIVLDIGCGTGIFAYVCGQGGGQARLRH